MTTGDDPITDDAEKLFALIPGTRKGLTALSILAASRAWCMIASIWLDDAISGLVKGEISKEVYDRLKEMIEAKAETVTLTQNAVDDIAAIQSALQRTVDTFNAGEIDRRRQAKETRNKAADNITLPFLKRLLNKQGVIAVLTGDPEVVAQFMHLSVGMLLREQIPVTFLADEDDDGLTAGLKLWQQDNHNGQLVFLDKWRSAGQESAWLSQILCKMSGIAVTRSLDRLIGTTNPTSRMVREVQLGLRGAKMSLLAGIGDNSWKVKTPGVEMVEVSREMKAGPQGELFPVYYVNGTQCIFKVE